MSQLPLILVYRPLGQSITWQVLEDLDGDEARSLFFADLRSRASRQEVKLWPLYKRSFPVRVCYSGEQVSIETADQLVSFFERQQAGGSIVKIASIATISPREQMLEKVVAPPVSLNRRPKTIRRCPYHKRRPIPISA